MFPELRCNPQEPTEKRYSAFGSSQPPVPVVWHDMERYSVCTCGPHPGVGPVGPRGQVPIVMKPCGTKGTKTTIPIKHMRAPDTVNFDLMLVPS